MRPNITVGLDIGTSKVAAVAAETASDGALKVISQATLPSRGIVHGAVTELNEAVDSVSAVLARLQDKMGRRPDEIYVNISGRGVKGAKSIGMIPLSMRGREITRSDMERCVDAAGTIHLPVDREVIHRIVHDFSINDQPSVKNPLGLYASRISCEVYIITADVSHMENLYKCVNRAGYDIKEVVYTGIAASFSLLEKNQKEEGSFILDIGASLTELSIFSEGTLSDSEIIAFGSQDIKGDFKESAGFESVLTSLRAKIEDFLNSGGKINSAVLTGGLAFTDGIIEFLESRLLLPIKMGVVKDVRGELSGIDSMKLATAIGLAKYAAQTRRVKALEGNLVRRISTKVVDIFNNYF